MNVQLTLTQLEALNVLESNQGRYFNTYELMDEEIAYPAQRVSELRARGAVFDVVLKPAVDRFGKDHPGVAHYCFRGWQI